MLNAAGKVEDQNPPQGQGWKDSPIFLYDEGRVPNAPSQ